MNKQILLYKIANHLIINSSFLNNIGLLHGKMGIVIFFYHYSRYINNPIFSEFAGSLLDEIFEEIHDKLPVDFENGYLGIGWGIEYLVEQEFVKGDTNSILYEIDKKVMERDVRRISDMSLNTGFEGVFHYILSRIHDNNTKYLFDKQYFSDLICVTDFLQYDILTALNDDYKCWYNNNKLDYTPSLYIKKNCLNSIPEGKRVYEWKLGLVDGCAGIGLNIMNI